MEGTASPDPITLYCGWVGQCEKQKETVAGSVLGRHLLHLYSFSRERGGGCLPTVEGGGGGGTVRRHHHHACTHCTLAMCLAMHACTCHAMHALFHTTTATFLLPSSSSLHPSLPPPQSITPCYCLQPERLKLKCVLSLSVNYPGRIGFKGGHKPRAFYLKK